MRVWILGPVALFCFAAGWASGTTLRPEFAHPGGCALRQFWMVFILPRRVLALQKLHELLPANFLSRCFYQEGAAPSRADQGVDFLEQVFG
jgi:hypothetical protein